MHTEEENNKGCCSCWLIVVCQMQREITSSFANQVGKSFPFLCHKLNYDSLLQNKRAPRLFKKTFL